MDHRIPRTPPGFIASIPDRLWLPVFGIVCPLVFLAAFVPALHLLDAARACS